jgi:hypothetical protein
MYSSTLPSTSALDRVGGQRHAPAVLPPGKDLVPTAQEAGWAPGPVWTGAENLAPIGIQSPDRLARSKSLSLPPIKFGNEIFRKCFPSGVSVVKITSVTALLYLGA